MTVGSKKLHYVKVHNLYSSMNVIKIMRVKDKNCKHGIDTITFENLVGKSEGNSFGEIQIDGRENYNAP